MIPKELRLLLYGQTPERFLKELKERGVEIPTVEEAVALFKELDEKYPNHKEYQKACYKAIMDGVI